MKSKNLQLSYSGMSCLQDCERKYYHRYVIKTPKDPDFVEPDYFLFGQAFHKLLEVCQHDERKLDSLPILKLLEKDYPKLSQEEIGKLLAMCNSYFRLLENVSKQDEQASMLVCKICELRLNLPKTIIVIDGVFENFLTGEWWLIDIKTTSTFDSMLPARIKRDPQLNHYAACKDVIAETLQLDPSLFAGIRYREISKPRTKIKEGENYAAFFSRIAAPKSREIIVNAKDLNPLLVWEEFEKYYSRAQEIYFAELPEPQGRCNFGNCIKWGSPCEFFSKCYGKTYTESLESSSVTIFDIQSNEKES